MQDATSPGGGDGMVSHAFRRPYRGSRSCLQEPVVCTRLRRANFRLSLWDILAFRPRCDAWEYHAARCATGSSAIELHLPKRHDQQIHRENPNKDHLPEPQIAGAIMIACHFRVAIEEAFPDTKNVKTRKENDHQADAEDDSQRENGIGMLVNDG
jgi:hypothetical protein